MWYFTWILGLGFAVLFAVVNALWLEAEEENKD
jgi:cyd operon protein YbgT